MDPIINKNVLFFYRHQVLYFCHLSMLIKYRSGAIHYARNVRRIKGIAKVVSRPVVHIRNSFTFKQPTHRWPPTIFVNRSTQTDDPLVTEPVYVQSIIQKLDNQMVNITTSKNDFLKIIYYHSLEILNLPEY